MQLFLENITGQLSAQIGNTENWLINDNTIILVCLDKVEGLNQGIAIERQSKEWCE
jgi:hypothetical protein